MDALQWQRLSPLLDELLELTLEARAARLALDPDRVLADNDSYVFHAALDGLIVTGPTGTNVNDLMIALVG